MERVCTREQRADTGGSRGVVLTYHSPYDQHQENAPLAAEGKLLTISYRAWQWVRGVVAGRKVCESIKGISCELGLDSDKAHSEGGTAVYEIPAAHARFMMHEGTSRVLIPPLLISSGLPSCLFLPVIITPAGAEEVFNVL